jgi:DNA-directed RNA polymerase specialized sigma24 family protein
MRIGEQGEDINAILHHYDPYIEKLIWHKMPRGIVPIEVLDLEIDELAQITRYKLWLVLRREPITNIKAYIRCIVNHEVINLIRRQKSHSVQPLMVDEQGELCDGRLLIALSEGMRDPSYEIEQEEMAKDCMLQMTEFVEALPPRQKYAIICSLKDRVDDLLQLIDTFMYHDIDIETVRWPTNKHDIQNLKASLSVARKKLEFLKRTRRVTEIFNLSVDK